jgi:hypothetical protein
MTFMLESVRPLHILIVIETKYGKPIYCNENYPAPAGRDGGGEALVLALVVRSAASRQAIPRAAAWS